MIRVRSRHLKCTARDKASAISIKILARDWLKNQNLTKNGLKFTFLPVFRAKFSCNVIAFAFAEFCLPWHMGNWFKSGERVALHSWKFPVSFYLKRIHNISFSRFKYCRS